MLTMLIRVACSCGIRIPAALREQIGFKDAVKVLAENDRIDQPQRTVGRRWEEALASLAECVDDVASLGEIPDLPKRNG
jgi:antitoxin component of MazEF toxin-antitoxin module